MSNCTLNEVGIGRIIAAGTQIKAAGRTIGRHVKDTPKDIKIAARAHRVLSRKQRGADLVRLAQNFSYANQAASTPGLPIQYKGGATKVASSARRAVQTRMATGKRLGGQRNAAVGRLAGRAFTVAAGVGALSAGRWAYNRLKKRASMKPRFSSVDVHPRHRFAAVRGERYNRPVYYNPDEIGAGPPRVYEGVSKMTREELIEMSAKALVKSGAKSYQDFNVKGGKAIVRGSRKLAQRSSSKMRKTFGKFEKKRVAKHKGRISAFNSAERLARTSKKHRKVYDKALKKSQRVGRRRDAVIGGVGGSWAGVGGAAAGAAVGHAISSLPSRAKSVEAQTHHRQAVHAVVKKIKKKQKADTRLAAVSSYRKEADKKARAKRKKNPIRKVYRKMAAKIAQEDRQEILSRMMIVLSEA